MLRHVPLPAVVTLSTGRRKAESTDLGPVAELVMLCAVDLGRLLQPSADIIVEPRGLLIGEVIGVLSSVTISELMSICAIS